MAISTKARYGLRAMLELAMANSKAPVSLDVLAKAQNIPRKYLSQLMAILRKEGLARSTRGAGGGYMLGREPSKMTALDIVAALEGSFAPVHCVDDEASCPKSSCCAARDLWTGVKEVITRKLGSITLEDLVRWQREKDANRSGMYHI